jgi:uncharacterized protein
MALIIGALILFLPLLGSPQEAAIPEPIDYISDYAGVIEEPVEAYLNGLLRELEEKTTAEIAVLTVKTTSPLDIFDYGMAVFDRWKIGAEGKDNGLLIVAATEDRAMHIFTGYGLEGILPDGKVGEVRDRDILPYFKLEDYSGGIRRGVEAFAAIIAQDAGVELTGLAPGEGLGEGPGANLKSALIVLVIIFIILYWLFSRRRSIGRPSPFPWIFWSGGTGSGGGGRIGGGFGGRGFGGFGGGHAGGGGAGGRW